MTDHEARQLLDAVMYYLPMEARRKVMAEVPMAYNAYIGRKVMVVTFP
jgi:hypothetical protein